MCKSLLLPDKNVAPTSLRSWSRVGAAQISMITALSVCVLLAACGDAPDTTPPTPPVPQAAPPTADPGTVAKQVIADFLSLPITDVTLVSSESKEFNNASLGCPEPGMSYPQVITTGHQVIVEADGRRFDVRVAGSHGRICHRKGREGQPNLPMKKNAPDHSSPITSQRDQIRDYRS